MKRRWYDPFTGAPGTGASGRTEPHNPRSHAPVPAGALVDQMIERRQWRARLDGSQIHRVWAAVAGDAVGEHVRPVRLHGGLLVLEADSGPWATQVRYLQQDLIDRANEELGSPLVERIQIRSMTRKR